MSTMKISRKTVISVVVIFVFGGLYIYINEPIKLKLIECFLPINQQNLSK